MNEQEMQALKALEKVSFNRFDQRMNVIENIKKQGMDPFKLMEKINPRPTTKPVSVKGSVRARS